MDWLSAFLWSSVLPFCLCASSSDCDNETQYFKADQCCFKCGPGSYMTSECDATKYSACQPCANGFYQGEWNKDSHCKKHSPCDSGEFEVIKAGDSVNDVVCLCKEGKHCANRDCEVCRDDDVCPPGSGVKTPGDRKYNGTVCEECREGFYSNESSSTEPCRRWMSCAFLGLIEDKPGSSEADIVCSVPVQDNGCCRCAVIPLALILVIFIALFICSQLGYLKIAMDTIRKRMARGDKEVDAEKAVGEADELHRLPTPETGLHSGIQEEGKDSQPSQEEQNLLATPMGREDFMCGQDANGNARR